MHRPTLAYQFGDVILNPETFSVEKSGRVLALEPKSIRLLLYLIQNRSRAVGKEELLSNVWEDVAVSDNALARVVAQLRKALGDDAKVARYIETVPTIGYRFVAEVVELPPSVASGTRTADPAEAPRPESLARDSLGAPPVALGRALRDMLTSAAIWIRARSAPPPSWSGTVLGGSIIASHPRISPDGQLLAFRAIIDSQSQVAVMRPDSSSWTALTHDRANGAVANVAWARDGSKIYFDREWGPGRIYSIGALGGEPRLVLENAWLAESLPDGSLVSGRHSSEGREQLLRFWPDSGRTQVLPATVRYTDSPNVRAFPDGREIAVFGLPAGAAGPPRPFVLNLESLEICNLGSDLAPAETLREPIAISRDGRSVLIQRRRNDTVDTIALPRSGSAPPQTLISLPGVAAPISQDVARDGSVYMDHSEFERSILILSSSGIIQAEIPVPQLAEGAGQRAVIALPDGGVVFSVRRRGRSDLFIARSGVEPQLLLNTPEYASLPGAVVGDGNLAFVIGAADRHIAIASLQDGRVIRRVPTDGHLVTSISAPADGHTIYYASNGIIWAQAASGGEPRRIGEGYDLAVEPSGKFLYLMRTGADGYQLFRMPAAGGEAARILLPAGFNMTPLPLSPSAIDHGGRILLPVNVLDIFFYQAAVFDPSRNTMKLVPAPPRAPVENAGWTPDGNIAALVVRWSSSLWRYRISVQNKGM
jgi:DNA-binding winged helix-turn-helix (wHTH) protein